MRNSEWEGNAKCLLWDRNFQMGGRFEAKNLLWKEYGYIFWKNTFNSAKFLVPIKDLHVKVVEQGMSFS